MAVEGSLTTAHVDHTYRVGFFGYLSIIWPKSYYLKIGQGRDNQLLSLLSIEVFKKIVSSKC